MASVHVTAAGFEPSAESKPAVDAISRAFGQPKIDYRATGISWVWDVNKDGAYVNMQLEQSRNGGLSLEVHAQEPRKRGSLFHSPQYGYSGATAKDLGKKLKADGEGFSRSGHSDHGPSMNQKAIAVAQDSIAKLIRALA